MEAFSLLRYRRTNGVDATKNDNLITPTAIVTAVSSETSETEDDDDHGPFFDLEFSLPGNEIGVQEHVKNCEEEEEDSDGSDESEEEEDDESELKLTSLFQSGSSGDSTGVSVSDDLFGFVPVEEIKSNPPQSRATKLRVMILKLKKTTDVNIVENEESGKSKAEVVSLFKRRNSSKQKKPQNDNKLHVIFYMYVYY
ncbi:putative membrane-associated kinase regulator 2 [Bidens hawaiensis]|uniref:putative membrane-associated kinase regulator 2 n=1 Tax=Bidens hawaiensis TaxID=980011 RepID=UPI00404B5B32